MRATKGMRFPLEVILVCNRWYVANLLSYGLLEEMIAQERGVFIDHSSINRWAIRVLSLFEKVFFASTSARWAQAGVWESFISRSRVHSKLANLSPNAFKRESTSKKTYQTVLIYLTTTPVDVLINRLRAVKLL